MGKYLKKFANHTAYETYINGSDRILPNVSRCVFEKDVHYTPRPHDYSKDYFTFVALEDGTFQFTNNVNYSLNNGETWTTLAANTASPTVTSGNKILWKGELTPAQETGIGTFSSTNKFNVQGNIMSLLYGNNFKEQTSLTSKDYAFYLLFTANENVTNAKNLILPSTVLVRSCY